MANSPDPVDLASLFEEERERFQHARRVLSYDEYLSLVGTHPQRHTRDAARYLRDLFDHFGTETVERPYGRATRWRLFDLPWEDVAGRRDALVGHESLQGDLYRVLSNFVRQGRVNRLVLLHGPNGSAKSTFVACLMRAMEHYATLDEGALYRFSWVFPRGKVDGGRIGFGVGREEGPRPGESYALLDESAIDAKVHCELRDHPLLLLSVPTRQRLLRRLLGERAAEEVPIELWKGGPCHKCQQVSSALHSAYRGDVRKVLAHVQVERWYISRRYRQGAITLGPQMAVDARERQVTASRSLAALPPSLQNTALFEPSGELVDAAGGLIEYSDLLKRSLEHWKYLLLFIETGEIALETSNLVPNVVLVGSSNEGHLDAFREHPEFASFRGRLELVRVPYLLDWRLEKAIYDAQVVPGVRRHVAPHATETAAFFAVLTRMRKAAADRYPRALGPLAQDLSPREKAELYASGALPARLSAEQAKELHAGIEAIYHEGDVYPLYEGRTGASPREMRGVLLDAAQHPDHRCLSPFAVLERIADLCTRKSEFDWLRTETVAGGYHDPKYFQKAVRERLLDTLEDEVRTATGLVDEARYVEMFERYVHHVSAKMKGERIRNKLTGRDDPPDEALMKDVEKHLGVVGSPEEFRRTVIARLAAWGIDHPGEAVPYTRLFPQHVQRLREAFFQDRRKQVVACTRELLTLLSGEAAGSLDAEGRRRAEGTFASLRERFGYCEHCARDAAAALLKERFADVKV
jgi:predicted Ser/Thr protein kinase